MQIEIQGSKEFWQTLMTYLNDAKTEIETGEDEADAIQTLQEALKDRGIK